jgi:transcriptional regulator with XRE-family HTH domain
MDEGMAQRIRELRQEKGLTLEQVADVVGVGKSTVRKWETGMIANMKRDKIADLAKALGTTPAYLMGWKEDTEKKDSPSEPLLTEGEKKVLELFRLIPEERQGYALEVLETLLKMQQKP